MPRPSVVPQVVSLILDGIRQRTLRPGQHLPSQELADMFKVSRAPVNAALKSLEESGIVRLLPNKGYFLADDPDSRIDGAQPEPVADVDEVTYHRIAVKRR